MYARRSEKVPKSMSTAIIDEEEEDPRSMSTAIIDEEEEDPRLPVEDTRVVPLFLEDECSICLDDYKKGSRVAMKGCGHTFHGHCIAKWVGECPLCRH